MTFPNTKCARRATTQGRHKLARRARDHLSAKHLHVILDLFVTQIDRHGLRWGRRHLSRVHRGPRHCRSDKGRSTVDRAPIGRFRQDNKSLLRVKKRRKRQPEFWSAFSPITDISFGKMVFAILMSAYHPKADVDQTWSELPFIAITGHLHLSQADNYLVVILSNLALGRHHDQSALGIKYGAKVYFTGCGGIRNDETTELSF